MTFGPVALAVASTAANVVGGIMQTRAEMQAQSYREEVAKRNAQLAEENARREMEASQIEGQDWGQAAAQQIADIIAERSASGTFLAGSNEARIRALRNLTARDQERIRQEGFWRMRARQQEAADFRQEAGAARSARGAAFATGVFNLGSSLIGGAQQISQARSGYV